MALRVVETGRAVCQWVRKFSVSCSGYNLNREGRMLGKMLANPIVRKPQGIPNPNRVVKPLDRRRQDIANKIFMTNITEALCFGGYEELLGKGLQITRVLVKNTNVVEVFWLANESQDPIQMQNILTSLAGNVRHQLTFSGMMGHIPHIVFRRDIASLRAEETQRLLQKVELEMRLEEDRKLVDEDGITEEEERVLNIEADPPKMRMDTLGLPYYRILNKIKDSKLKSYPLQVPIPPTPEEFQQSLSVGSGQSGSVLKKHQSKKELRKFISLYQKSELCSSARRTQEEKEVFDFYYEKAYDDEDDLNSEHERRYEDDLSTGDERGYEEDFNSEEEGRHKEDFNTEETQRYDNDLNTKDK